MNDALYMLGLLGLLVAAIGLCVLGDLIRRRTRGRIRHAEIHLLAWVPTLLLEGVVIHFRPTSAIDYPVPLLIAAIVYLTFLGDIRQNRSAWQRSEERLDRVDAELRREASRRQRIEGYKHKGRARDETRR